MLTVSEVCTPEGVHVDGLTGLVLSLVILLETNLPVHTQPMERSTSLHKGPAGSENKVREVKHEPHSNINECDHVIEMETAHQSKKSPL